MTVDANRVSGERLAKIVDAGEYIFYGWPQRLVAEEALKMARELQSLRRGGVEPVAWASPEALRKLAGGSPTAVEPKEFEEATTPLITLSSHQSVIAAKDAEIAELRRERDEFRKAALEDSGNIVNFLSSSLEAAEARANAAEKERDDAFEWIRSAPHDDHCFTNDPNPDACRCVCGKDALLEAHAAFDTRASFLEAVVAEYGDVPDGEIAPDVWAFVNSQFTRPSSDKSFYTLMALIETRHRKALSALNGAKP